MTTRLRTLLGTHPCTAALKDGSVKSDSVTLDFADYSPTHKGFKPMIREQAFDVSEMAIVTYLMAKSFAKPMVLLPSVVVARFQHPYAVYRAELGDLKPGDLKGKRVGAVAGRCSHLCQDLCRGAAKLDTRDPFHVIPSTLDQPRHESSSSAQRPPRGWKTGPRRPDRRRQVRLDVSVAGAAHAGARGARDRRSRSRARTRGLPHGRLG